MWLAGWFYAFKGHMFDSITNLLPQTSSNVFAALGGVFVALLVGSAVRLWPSRARREPSSSEDRASLRTWWVLTVCLALAVLLGRVGVVLLIATASVLGLREYLKLTGQRDPSKAPRVVAFLGVAVIVALLLIDRPDAVLLAMPLLLALVLVATLLTADGTEGFITRCGPLLLGVLLLAVALPHAALVMTWPPDANPVAGPAGWFVLLVLLTECNDIAQSVCGRAVGRRKLTPRLSPGKTWEGFAGGVVVTALLSVALTPLLAPLDKPAAVFVGSALDVPMLWPAILGVLLSVCGLLGDLTMSAVKRDVGVKDSGVALPGHGGVLDRIDSLTFTAPTFFYYVELLYFVPSSP